MAEEEIKLALDVISKKENGNKALEILDIISYFAPENIHTEMFLILFDNEEELGAAIKLLKQYLIVNSSQEETTLNVNKLVQKVVRKNLGIQKKENAVLKKALGLLLENGINSNKLDHAISVCAYMGEYRGELIQQFSDLSNTIVKCLDNIGRPTESYVFAKKQWNLLQSSLGTGHINTLKMRNNMGLMLSNCGKYQEALDIFQEVYKKLKNMQEIDEYMLIVQHNIAFAFSNLGRDKEALDLYKKVLQKRKEILGINHPDTLLTQTNMAAILSSQQIGRHDEALDALSEVYNKQKEIFGSDDLSTLTTQHNMGSVLLEQGKFQESLNILNEVFNKRKKILGLDHSTTLMTWCQIAQALCRQNKYDESINILQQAHKRFEKSLGAEHPHTLKMSAEIAAVLFMQGKVREGQDICNQVHNKQKEILRSDHPNNVAIKNLMDTAKLVDIARNLSGVDNLISLWNDVSTNEVLVKEFSWLPSKIIENLKDDQKYKEAILFGKQAIGLLKKVVGLTHTHTLDAQSKLAMALDAYGSYQEAFDIYQEVYQRGKKILGPQETLSIRNNMALILLELGEYQKALSAFNDVFQKQKETIGPNHRNTLSTQANIARTLDKQGKYEDAVNIYKEVLNREAKILEPDHLSILTLRHNMAALLSRQGKYEEALSIFKDVFEKREKILGKYHPETLTTQNNIGRVLCEEGKDHEALNVLEMVHYNRKKVFGSNNPHTLLTQVLIAQVLFKQCKYQEALNIYQEVYPKQKKILGSFHPEILALKNNIDIAKILLQKNVAQNKRPLLLHSLAKEGNFYKLRSLIQNGANINTKDDVGSNPLHWAAHNGHKDIVKLLLDNGADVTQVTNKGNTPLHIASSKGHKEIIEVLLKHVSDNKLNGFINAQTIVGGTTSLHVAAKNGFLEIVKSLLKHGATYNIENKEGKVPFDLSKDQNIADLLKLVEELFEDAKNGHIEIISKLSAIKPDEFTAITKTRNDQGNTLLQVAIVNKHNDIAHKLLEILKSPGQV